MLVYFLDTKTANRSIFFQELWTSFHGVLYLVFFNWVLLLEEFIKVGNWFWPHVAGDCADVDVPGDVQSCVQGPVSVTITRAASTLASVHCVTQPLVCHHHYQPIRWKHETLMTNQRRVWDCIDQSEGSIRGDWPIRRQHGHWTHETLWQCAGLFRTLRPDTRDES